MTTAIKTTPQRTNFFDHPYEASSTAANPIFSDSPSKKASASFLKSGALSSAAVSSKSLAKRCQPLLKPSAAVATIAGAAYFGWAYGLVAGAVWAGHYLSQSCKSAKPVLPIVKPPVIDEEDDKELDAFDALDRLGVSEKSQLLSAGDIIGTTCQYKQKDGNAACAAIAALAADKMLSGRIQSPRDVDQTVREGIELYQNIPAILEAKNGFPLALEDKQMFSLDMCLAGSHLGETYRVDTKGGFLMTGHEVNLSPRVQGYDSFIQLLTPLQQAAERKKIPTAAVLTLIPETFTITYDPKTARWQYFNSHGNDTMRAGTNAALLSFDSIDELAFYLAEKKMYVDPKGVRNADINRCVLYILHSK